MTANFSRISPIRSAGLRQRPAQAGDLRHLAGFRSARGQGRGGRLCACLRRVGGGDRAGGRRGARGQGRLFRAITPSRRRAAMSSFMATTARSPRRPSKPKRSFCKPSMPMPAPRIRGCARSRRASPRPGRRSRFCAATARPIATCGRWCGCPSRSWSATATARKPAATAMAAAKATSASSPPMPGRARSTTPSARLWSISKRFRRPPARWTSCSVRAGPASCCTRRSVTGSKATSTARRRLPLPD